MENKDKKKRFRIFDLQKDGKGISKNQKTLEPGLKRFFISLKNNFGKIVSVNMIMILGNFPAFFLIMALAGVTKNDIFVPISDIFQNLNGVLQASDSTTAMDMTLVALRGLQLQDLAPSVMTYVFYAIGAITLFTFGPVNAGTAYVIRNLVSGEPVFVFSDFIYALKRNIKQALPFGIIDAAICALLTFNIYTLVFESGQFIGSMLFWSELVLLILYFFMRFYIYVQMVTFKLSVFKILKNSLIFALLGFKRNFMALIGIILCLVLEVLFLFGSGGILVPLAIAAPLALFFALFSYMKVYASYFKIKEIMIDPYVDDSATQAYDDAEIIMRDDVTEKERLEEIKRRNSI